MAALILVVDDDPIQRRLLEAMARRFGYEVETLEFGEAALARLQASDRPPVDLLILDLVMPDLDGMGVLARMRQRDITVPAIVQTAHGSIEAVISAMRAGAIDFVVKPVGAERLQVSIKNALQGRRARGRVAQRDAPQRRRTRLSRHRQPGRIMARTVRLAERAAKSNIPVLIEGESGVGKELMARAIQGSSERRGKPFVTVNCGALPETLVESILFGHEKGSFTGATEKHVGKFAEANGGTLFLDEIGELPLDAQVKLLRALQEGEIDPVGARRPVKVDIRLVSATNQNLIELVKARALPRGPVLSPQRLPHHDPAAARARRDVPDLARRFLARFCAEEGKRIRGISDRGARAARRLRLAGQRPPARERRVPRRRARRRRRTDHGGISADRGAGRRLRRAHSAGAAAGRRRSRPVAPPCGRRRFEPRDPHALRLINDNGDVRKLEEIEAEIDPLRARPLSRPDVASGAQARHRPLDPLSKDEGHRHCRRRDRRTAA